MVKTCVTDQGTHYKNEAINQLHPRFGCASPFTTARSPWTNCQGREPRGTSLRAALLSEWRMKEDWPRMVNVLQMHRYRHSEYSPSDRDDWPGGHVIVGQHRRARRHRVTTLEVILTTQR
ncbi:hypothetical protein PsorP6_001319 [Peronosclerospora sorghi]|uniref:Uncharacterized protein n=1 Tax=Peronosclerospora sorghi TaxID=230839 RepID=A0ACC0WXX5_9STRA|nr:hypothetical protein PsorP6_001319 [Peronosclerospora sorghi]